ncbi:MAG TPA: hypothetical protein VLI90_15850, partial [Tepidisphaeraceae bacterium]|nr:hypothetical protein [Tepidisphaeraceae bacterium]
MAVAAPQASWTPLELLKHRFIANVDALAARYPQLAQRLRELSPSQTYFIQAYPDHVRLGAGSIGAVNALPHPLLPVAALDLAKRLFSDDNYDQPVLVSGEDLGWLWNRLYALPCNVPTAPGYRPPMHCLIRDVERLWVILHLQDWRQLLADARVRLFAGDDAFDQFRRSLVHDSQCPWPKLSVTIDPALWPAGQTIDTVLAAARAAMTERLTQLNQRLRLMYAGATPASIASLFQSGRPLRILGVTSRYTTFLQHSMRDWLAAFDRLGHETRLFIEPADHEVPNNFSVAQACADFHPDLAVIIDHYRTEMGGFPDNLPVVMWVQDALSNLFTPKAGAAQGERDYALGFAHLKMTREFGYPAARYMPAIVAVNEQRFAPQALTPSERDAFTCDVSFVSNASTPAESILQAEITRLDTPQATRLLTVIFEQIKSIYDAGGSVTEPITIRRIVDAAMIDTQTTLPPEQMPALMDLFTQRINNALFRHQSLEWLAGLGVNVHLYGRGWESHPTLRRFARGVADNVHQLSKIYQASRINLQISPHGAVHQRVLEGLCTSGFFLFRHCPGDVLEREFEAIWRWCQSQRITSDDQLRQRATPEIARRLARVAELLQLDPFAGDHPFIDVLHSSQAAGYIRSAGSVWVDDYDAVSFRSNQELRAKVTH